LAKKTNSEWQLYGADGSVDGVSGSSNPAQQIDGSSRADSCDDGIVEKKKRHECDSEVNDGE
jgi:hypothetical protein